MGDVYVDQRPGEVALGLKEQQLVVAGAAVPLALARAFDQDFLAASDQLGVDLGRDAGLNALDLVDAALLFLGRHVVVPETGGGSARARRVHGDVYRVKSQALQKSQRVFEL